MVIFRLRRVGKEQFSLIQKQKSLYFSPAAPRIRSGGAQEFACGALRRPKYFFKSLSEAKSVSRYMPKISSKKNLLNVVIKKPILPSPKEIKENPPSRSAKLRYAIKKHDFYNFETDILDKFKYLIDIENYSKKL